MTALAAAFLLLPASPQEPPEPAAADPALLQEQLVARDAAISVKLVSGEGESELLDVVSHGAPAFEVLVRVAQATGRTLKLGPGDAAPRSHRGVDANLKRRPLREVVAWIAGAAGLVSEVTRGDVRCEADLPEVAAPEQALARAIDAYRTALLHDPTRPDAPRLRFEIGNALYQLGDFLESVSAYHDLERDSPEFGDLPFAYFRCGHAHAQLGDEVGAQAQWLAIAELFPRHRLVAAARLAAVRSFRRQKDEVNASLALRFVVEGMRDGLAPEDLIEAGELLNEGGSSERAVEALRCALRSTSDPELEERGLTALARAQAGRRDWTGVIATADGYVKRHPDGPRAAEIEWLLAVAHRELGDPFTALLALARARELRPDDRIEMKCDLLEGQIYAESGLAERAQRGLARAGACDFPEIAAPALAAHARLLIDGGQFEAARRLYERLTSLPDHEVEAAIGLAEVSLLQHNRRLCLAVVNETLPHATGRERDRLLELALEALHQATPGDLEPTEGDHER